MRRVFMKRYIATIVSLIVLLLQATLVIVPSITTASAAGNVTINDFTSNVTKGTIPLEARLNSNVTGNVTTYLWEFYNPQFDRWSYSTANVTTGHTFGITGAYGVFNVTLIVSGPDGNASLKKIDYVVANQNTTGLPVANFSASSISGIAPLNVTFTDNSTDSTSSLWYFGLKNTSKEKDPTFNFTSPGTYRIVLEVHNARGWDATAQEIIVQGQQQENVLPVADFDTDTSNGLNIQFVDTSQNANKTDWYFGDGTNSTDFSSVHTYSTAGTYTVNLTVSNANGTASKTATINVSELPISMSPVANFIINVPLTVQFTDSSENVTEWNWDFGDGMNSTDQNPTHTYSTAGIYTVNLTVSNANRTDSKTAIINVSEKPVSVVPVANFSTNVTSGNVPISVQFNDSSENATQWFWDFGDGNNSTEQNPVHIYSTAGNYTVNLTASNGNGMNSTFANITVLERSV
jgi:PKD repeat protein